MAMAESDIMGSSWALGQHVPALEIPTVRGCQGRVGAGGEEELDSGIHKFCGDKEGSDVCAHRLVIALGADGREDVMLKAPPAACGVATRT